LTPRETEVLARVARGETDQQIADRLFLSRRTVSNHVSSILGKLDVANRRDAVVAGFRIGLL
jgi:DNA-binding NarL/FixJ family response regulator